jgi:FKBP-type peptidyl-prolyl cis-trans isomerase
MRRAAALVITALIAVGAAVGCGSSSSSSSQAAAGADTNKSVTVTGAFGKSPTVKIPAAKGSTDLYTAAIIKGTGAKLTASQGLVGNYVAYDWSGKTNKQLGSSFTTKKPSLFAGQLLPGLQKALVGQPLGSRVLAVIPPADGFGTTGNSQEGIGATDNLVFVIDMLSTFNTNSVPGQQTSNGGGALPTVKAPAAGSAAGPTVTINTKAAPPKTLQVKTLVKGTGAVVKKDQDLAVQYVGSIWRTGKVFQSSWTTKQGPFSFVVGENQVIPGWDKGLIGQTVGSRVLLVIPPADGYGSAGQSAVGIKGTDTLVFVVDILAAE